MSNYGLKINIKDHIHKYKKVNLGGMKVVTNIKTGKKELLPNSQYKVFKCQLSGCKTFKAREIVIGEKSICWKCGEELLLDSNNTRATKPIHEYCKKIKQSNLGDVA